MKAKISSYLSEKALLQVTLHCSISQETAFFIYSTAETSNNKCIVIESNERAEISKDSAGHTSNFKPAAILLRTFNLADSCLDFASGHIPMVLQGIA